MCCPTTMMDSCKRKTKTIFSLENRYCIVFIGAMGIPSHFSSMEPMLMLMLFLSDDEIFCLMHIAHHLILTILNQAFIGLGTCLLLHPFSRL